MFSRASASLRRRGRRVSERVTRVAANARHTARHGRRSCSSDFRDCIPFYTVINDCRRGNRSSGLEGDDVAAVDFTGARSMTHLCVGFVQPLVLGAEPFPSVCPACRSDIRTTVTDAGRLRTNYNPTDCRSRLLGLVCCVPSTPTRVSSSFRHSCPRCHSVIGIGLDSSRPAKVEKACVNTLL